MCITFVYFGAMNQRHNYLVTFLWIISRYLWMNNVTVPIISQNDLIDMFIHWHIVIASMCSLIVRYVKNNTHNTLSRSTQIPYSENGCCKINQMIFVIDLVSFMTKTFVKSNQKFLIYPQNTLGAISLNISTIVWNYVGQKWQLSEKRSW